MNTPKNSDRIEKLRRARSLNDVVAVIKNIATEIGRSKNAVARLSATASATNTKGKSSAPRKISISAGNLKVGHDGFGEDIQVVRQETPSAEGKKANRAVFRNKPAGPGKKLDEKSYHAPTLKTAEQIQKKVDIIHDLHDNIVELDAAREKIKLQFRGATKLKAAIDGLQALQDEVHKTLMQAYGLLEDIAQKHLPPPMEEMRAIVSNFISESIPSTKHDELREEMYVTVKAPTSEDEGVATKGPKKIKIDVSNAEFAFYSYIILPNLKNSSGFEFEEYCVVLTGLVDRHLNLRYFLNALPDFKSPGKFNIGQEVNNEHDVAVRLSMLMAHNDVVTEIERKPMPLTTKTAKEKGFHAIDGVKAVHVVDDTLRVTVTKKDGDALNKHRERKLDTIKAEVRSLLNAVIGKRSKSKVLPRVTHDKDDNYVLIFSLIPDIPDSNHETYELNVNKLMDLKHVLGLPDDVIEDVKHAMLRRT